MPKMLIFLCCLLTFSCKSTKLLVPVKEGLFPSKNSSVSDSQGQYIFIIPTKSSYVLSAEDCKVLQVIKQREGYIILAKGKYTISYSELESCNVNQGQNLKKGEKVGELEHMSSEKKYLSNYVTLTMTIQDSNNHYITDLSIFKNN